jgi:hypothetical protein
MKKSDALKILALIVIPGTIPVWIGYKVYERFFKDGQGGESSGPNGDDAEDEVI